MELHNNPGRNGRLDDTRAKGRGAQESAENRGAGATENSSTAQANGTQAGAAGPLDRAAHGDTVELSAAAAMFDVSALETTEARTQLIQELKRAYEDGSLNTTERMTIAAERLLRE